MNRRELIKNAILAGSAGGMLLRGDPTKLEDGFVYVYAVIEFGTPYESRRQDLEALCDEAVASKWALIGVRDEACQMQLATFRGVASLDDALTLRDHIYDFPAHPDAPFPSRQPGPSVPDRRDAVRGDQ